VFEVERHCGPTPRRLRETDLPDLVTLSTAAGWNQIEQDWLRLIRLVPEGCFGVELDGHIVATTTAICYGRDLAWIGMVLTHPAYRRRGLARALMEHALAWLDQQGVEWIGLDATEMGEPLYRSLGFEAEESIERWAAQAPGHIAGEVLPVGFEAELDEQAYGVSRRVLLEHLAAGGSYRIRNVGYALWRPGRLAYALGPCIARTPEAAERLIRACLACRPGENWFWDLLPANVAAVELARHYGFTPRRHLVRMWRPGRAMRPRPRFRNEWIYATAGFEYG